MIGDPDLVNINLLLLFIKHYLKGYIMDKRAFLKRSVLAGASFLFMTKNPLIAVPNTGVSGDNNTPFAQSPLPYGYGALEPYIDAQTMEIHYSKHHATYTKNFNAAVMEQKLEGKSIEEIFKNTSKYPAAIRNQGGGYYNHKLFWDIMAPNAGGEPSGKIAEQITKDFGSFAQFQEAFSKAAASVFGSGWAWLILKDKKLQIITLPNQDNPLMDIAPVQGKPILYLDVWEHAYYLKHQNKRADYISAFWKVINWKKVENNLFI
jgi:superoxide dismutase, Fe-Mn family